MLACEQTKHLECVPSDCEVANFEYRERKLYPLYCPECERPVNYEFMVCFSCQVNDYR